MDEFIEHKTITKRTLVIGFALCVMLASLAAVTYSMTDLGDKAATSSESGLLEASITPFSERLNARGTVTPEHVTYLDANIAGRVERIFVEEGDVVEENEPVLKLSNTRLQLEFISRDAAVSEQLNDLRNTELAMKQANTQLAQDILNTEYELDLQLDKKRRMATLVENSSIARSDLEETNDRIEYLRKKLKLLKYRKEVDTRLRKRQMEQLQQSAEQLSKNLKLSRKILDYLTVRAPTTGRVTSLDAKAGEYITIGQRVGQIDSVDHFIVQAQIDEYYAPRLRKGLKGIAVFNKRELPVQVESISSEIKESQVEVKLSFLSDIPQSLTRGLSCRIELTLSDQVETLTMPLVNGRMSEFATVKVHAINSDGEIGATRSLRLGRRSGSRIEVIDGAKPGQKFVLATRN